MPSWGHKTRETQLVRKTDNRLKEIGRYIWTEHAPIADVAIAETTAHLPLSEAEKLKYRPMKKATAWGQPWGTAWFRIRATVPKAFKGETVSLIFASQGECIIFRNGLPVQGLDENRSDYILFDAANGGERIEIYVEAGANGAFGNFRDRTAQVPSLAVFNHDVFKAYWDGRSLHELAGENALPPQDPWRSRIVFELNKAVDLFDYQDLSRESLTKSAQAMSRCLKSVHAHKASDSAQTVACMGHAHIDVAWLWPLAETVRKCGRTFSNVLSLMDRYPEFVFCQSQPHLYEFAKERYPSIYKRIKQKVKEGKWIPTGCSWVEMDCNVTSGESLVRQILFGTRFYKKEFNHTPACMWIPDVFGYAASMPQILKRSGINNFLTQKISWSEYTKFPYNSFYWEGIDGSQVLSHFPPNNNYNSQNRANQTIPSTQNYAEKDRSDIQAALFGYGDGGGGPTKETLERMRRFRNLEGSPKLTPMSPTTFFKELEARSQDLPRWVGELYLEYHRGTYTTQGWTKRNNRKGELLLRETEFLSALNMAAGGRYESKRINDSWKTVLLNQFHDILPGSSITKVYEDTERDYAIAFDEASAVRGKASDGLRRRIDTRGAGRAIVVHNALSWGNIGCVSVPSGGGKKARSYVATDASGNTSPVQKGIDGQLRFSAAVPAMGHTVVHLSPGKCDSVATQASERMIENEHLRVRLNKDGLVISLYDKENRREAIEGGGAANQFQLFEDKSNAFGAWDIDIYYQDKMLERGGELVSSKLVEHGPVRSVIRQVRRISKSAITQDIILSAGAKRLEFDTTVDWGDEKNVLLKVAFPVEVRSDKARYEIQFGSLERPTHWNTANDYAKFEVAAQKWADLSESDYGVALLNDCKYGHDIRDNVMRLTLLRAPKNPDRTADINKQHRFCYALYPHSGSFLNGVVRQGYELNVPLCGEQVAASAGKIPAEQSWFGISGENVIIDTVKKAEDDKGIIVRMYEAHGQRGRRTFSTAIPAKKIIETDLMEKEEQVLKQRNGKVSLTLKPFQIRTLKIVMK